MSRKPIRQILAIIDVLIEIMRQVLTGNPIKQHGLWTETLVTKLREQIFAHHVRAYHLGQITLHLHP